MNKKVTLVYIIGIILIGIIVIAIVLADMRKGKEDPKPAEIENGAVTSQEVYYTIQGNIQRFLTFSNIDVTQTSEGNAIGGRKTSAEIFKLTSEEDKKAAILDLLDSEFKQRNKIDQNNIEEYVEITQNQVKSCFLEDIKVKQGENNIEIYAIEVSWKSTNKETNEEMNNNEKFIVRIDKNNKTFSVKPISEFNLDAETNYTSIEKNSRNTYTDVELNEGGIAAKYLDRYKNMMLNNPDKAYEHLDEEYRNKRFENIDNFKKYIEDFKEEISGLTTVQYITNIKDGYTEYVCKDQHENMMIFNVKSVMDFTVKLDTHTILSEENINLYNNASEEEKVTLNTQRFIDMLNTRDYHTIYNLIDQGFKRNHALTEEKMTYYFKEYYFNKTYTYKTKSVDKQDDIYIQEIYLYEKGTDQKDENYSNKIQLMMQLKDGMDFRISLGYVNF